jgi:cation diffusion facilitator family transporter
MSARANSLAPIFYALGANFAIFVAKSAAAFVTGSSAMLAEAIHSLADCGNQGLLLFGIRSAKRPPTDDYPLGYGRDIYFWSFVVALVLFSMGGLFSLYEGWHKLQEGEPLERPWIAIAILAFSVVAESVSLWGVLREIAKMRHGRTLWRWFRDSRQSELVVVLGEDLAALVGLMLALLAVCAAVLTGNPAYDAAGSMAIGVVLIIVAAAIAIEVKGLLVGQSADPEVERAIRAFIEARPEVERVLRIITLQLGDTVMVSVKALMRERSSAEALVHRINECEKATRSEFPQIQWLFFEPDTAD